MSLDRQAITSHIPHAGSMCLLDEVTSWDADLLEAASLSHARAGHPLASGCELHAVHLVEYVAQAAAMHGALAAEVAGEPPPGGGLLAGLRQTTLHVQRVTRNCGPLGIRVRRLLTQTDACLYHGEVRAAGRLLLSARLAIHFPAVIPEE